MLTPEQLEEVSFGTAKFGGYQKQDVDAFLGPLIDDYIALHKENALLKGKMKVLVAKLEEYRAAESSMKEAVVSTQKSCDAMIAEAEAKCNTMLKEAGLKAEGLAEATDALVQAENARLEEARQLAYRQISELQKQLESCLNLLAEIKDGNLPKKLPTEQSPFKDEDTVEVAKVIEANLEALVGKTEDDDYSLPPLDKEALPNRFSNLQFGKNYDPNHH